MAAWDNKKSIVKPVEFDINGEHFKFGIWEIFNGANQWELAFIYENEEKRQLLAAIGATENFTKHKNNDGKMINWLTNFIEKVNKALDIFFEELDGNQKVPKQNEMEEAFNLLLERVHLENDRFIVK